MGMNEGLRESGRSTFDKQFLNREHIPITGGEVEVVDIPAPADSEKNPIVLVPAWGMSPDVYKYTLKAFSDAGRRTLSFTFPSTGGSGELPPEDRKSFEGFPLDTIRDALTVIAVLEAQGVESAGIVGHSKGGASSAIAALLFAERAARGEGKKRIANLELFGSAGLIGKDSLPRLGYGFAMQQSNRGKQSESFGAIPVSDEQRAAAAAEGRTIAEYAAVSDSLEDPLGGTIAAAALGSHIKEGGFSRTAGEVWGLSKIQIHSLFRELKKHGIGITVMTGVDDPVFPTGSMTSKISEQLAPEERALDYEKKIDVIAEKIVDGVLTIRAEHAIPVPYAPIIESQLSALEEKQKRATARAGTSDE